MLSVETVVSLQVETETQPNSIEMLKVERLEDHFPFLERELGGLAVHLVRASSPHSKFLDDIQQSVPGVTDIVVAVGNGELPANLYARALEVKWTGSIHLVEASGSNSLSRTLKAHSLQPLEASSPNPRYESVAIKMLGQHVIDIFQDYPLSMVKTAHDEWVTELATEYKRRKKYVAPLDAESLLAIEGLRSLHRYEDIADNAQFVVVGTDYNESYEQLLVTRKRRSYIATGYTVR